MNAAARREEILAQLEHADAPVPAAALGERLGVSRQIVVGDVALLRASGHAVHATNRGYVLARPAAHPRRAVHVRHGRDDMRTELTAILDAGGSVLDTSVEHRLYGQLTVDLLIHDRTDLELFLERAEDSTALAELTNGWHTHTIEADSEERLDDVERALDELGFLQHEE
ncbi:transcription repressor NadR [Actinomyces radicidentis]|uniref:transcription repressor NadR n=1 Tax=Actinomyces radicidentis TaxID=111015 RepID=UPI0028E8DAA9|nr:transcription repressor NadR [Actinomyces radicidentis]